MEIPAGESPETGGIGAEAMGDRRNRISDRAAVLRPVFEDERGELSFRVIYILRGDLEPRVFQGRVGTGSAASEQAAPVPRPVSNRLFGAEPERDGSPAGESAKNDSRRMQAQFSGDRFQRVEAGGSGNC